MSEGPSVPGKLPAKFHEPNWAKLLPELPTKNTEKATGSSLIENLKICVAPCVFFSDILEQPDLKHPYELRYTLAHATGESLFQCVAADKLWALCCLLHGAMANPCLRVVAQKECFPSRKVYWSDNNPKITRRYDEIWYMMKMMKTICKRCEFIDGWWVPRH